MDEPMQTDLQILRSNDKELQNQLFCAILEASQKQRKGECQYEN